MDRISELALPEGAVLLDGGLGQELLHRGLKTHPLWSAYALVSAQAKVLAVHLDYIAAGARIITTNSYSTARPRLERHGMGERFHELNRSAGELACWARDESGAEVLIAGSLAPLHGSYRPDRVVAFEEAEPLYREQAEILAPFVDVFLCETMSSGVEARAAAAAAAAAGKPVWVAWTLADGGSARLRSGETIAQAAAQLQDLPVSGFFANCCAPESVTLAMPELAEIATARGGIAGGYANGFSAVPKDWDYGRHGLAALGLRRDLDPFAYAAFAMDWVEAGAKVVGGCCEVGPAHIARLRQRLGEGSR